MAAEAGMTNDRPMRRLAADPLVTIAIPNYNGGRYVDQALDSALAQTFGNIEVVVVDNASTDGSRQLIAARQATDDRIVVRNHTDHVSAIKNWNRCLDYARGRYIVFLHADDRLKPEFVARSLEVFSQRPDLGYVYCEKEIIDHDGQVVLTPQFYDRSGIIPGLAEARINLLGWHTVAPQMLIRTECMRKIGGYDYTDVLAVLLLNLGWDVGYVVAPLVQYRRHAQADTHQFVKDKTMIMTVYLTKMLVLNYHLPAGAESLRELKPQVMQRSAHACLATYAMDVLGHNEIRLCREYLCLARSFWLDIDQSPLYQFLEAACGKDGWTPETLHDAWRQVPAMRELARPPYPLPEGAVAFRSGED